MDIFQAAAVGDLKRVDNLLKEGVDVNTESSGWTSLFYASSCGHVDVVRLLLRKGANLHLKDEDEWTVLFWASRNGHFEVAKILLEHGAEVNATSNKKDTAFIWACKGGHLKVVELLIQYGANVNAKGLYGWDAFTWVDVYKVHNIRLLFIKHSHLFDVVERGAIQEKAKYSCRLKKELFI